MDLVQASIQRLGIERNLTLPPPPTILKVESGGKVRYRGTAGAHNYSIVSSENSSKVIESGIFDNYSYESTATLDLISLSVRTFIFEAQGDWGKVSSAAFTV